MFDYSGYREVERDNKGYGTCDRFSELHFRLKLTLFKQPLRIKSLFSAIVCVSPVNERAYISNMQKMYNI
jgi:hypothetical protein